MKIGYAELKDLPRYWPTVAPMLQDALDQACGEMTLDDVYTRLMVDQDMWLLVGYEPDTRFIRAAFTVTRVIYPQYHALRVVLAGGGSLDEWLEPLVELLERGCAKLGARQIELFGRPGFTRALKGMAEHTYTVMVRKVGDDERRQRDDDHDQRANAGPVATSV